ncbi:MAG: flagellar basal body P-ring formation chaperone FlgA [Candidatus Margulisbacteria bacterium]|nr:flagellar basal body P-ring formation chaperone FlgA [Candidatus Margulisiibacteriota bacterium]
MLKKYLLGVILIGLLITLAGFANDKSNSEKLPIIYQEIEAKIIQTLNKHFTQWKDAEVVVVANYSNYQQNLLKQFPEGAAPEINIGIPGSINPTDKMIVTIEILLAGKSWQKFQTRCNIQAWDMVCVAKEDVPEREILSTKNILLTKADIADYSDQLFRKEKEIIGWESKTKIKKGYVILPWMIQPMPNFRQGEEIDIIYKNEGITLKFKGKALEDGFLGKKVKFYRSQSRKKFIGTVVDNKTVLIE